MYSPFAAVLEADIEASLSDPRAKPRSMVVWLHDYQINHFDGRAGRLSGFSGILPTGIAWVRLESRQNNQLPALPQFGS